MLQPANMVTDGDCDAVVEAADRETAVEHGSGWYVAVLFGAPPPCFAAW